MIKIGELEAELSGIEISPNFSQVKEKYENDRKVSNIIGLSVAGGGAGLVLMGLFGLVLARRRTRKRNERNLGPPKFLGHTW